MSKATKALLICLVTIVAVECGLRWLLTHSQDLEGVPTDRKVAFVLGTSRTQSALDPLAIEAELKNLGGPGGLVGLDGKGPWVADVAGNALTTMGELLLYIDSIRPLARGRRGIVAIEVRYEGLNDHYATTPEIEAILKGRMKTLLPDEEINELLMARYEDPVQHIGSSRWLANLTTEHIHDLTRAATGRLVLGSGRDTLRQLGHQVAVLFGAQAAPPFAVDKKGFAPQLGQRKDDLDVGRWGPHYKNELMRRLSQGGLQFHALEKIIALAREDGFEPVMFVMPVTDIHKTFLPDGMWARSVALVKGLAEKEKIPLVDFDADGKWNGHELFFDTHHMAPVAAPGMSAEFARRVLAPALGGK